MQEKGKEMDFLLLLLSESLRNREPRLDLGGADRKVLSIAIEDLRNYLKVHWRLIGKETAESELRAKVRQCFYERMDELEELVDFWVGMWIKKWNERVKLVIGDKTHRHLKNIHGFSGKGRSKWKSLTSWSGAEETAIEALIRNGEICGTKVLAQSLLKSELGEPAQKKTDRDDLVVVVNNLLKRARELSESSGPLMFIRVDKRFWNVQREDSRRKIY
jgi:Trm5-related predicted tRNA methylase